MPGKSLAKRPAACRGAVKRNLTEGTQAGRIWGRGRSFWLPQVDRRFPQPSARRRTTTRLRPNQGPPASTPLDPSTCQGLGKHGGFLMFETSGLTSASRQCGQSGRGPSQFLGDLDSVKVNDKAEDEVASFGIIAAGLAGPSLAGVGRGTARGRQASGRCRVRLWLLLCQRTVRPGKGRA
jgi:hypothetical protein